MREMSEVIVYYDGTWEIKDLDCNYATQHIKGKYGEWYHCLKGREEYYKKRLVKSIISRQEEKVKKEQETLNNLKEVLTNIDWYDIIHISVGGRIWIIKFYKKKNIPVKVLNGF